MGDKLTDMEREVEQELACWAGRLETLPSVELVESVRAVVRLELNEAWLSGQRSPAPEPEVLERVRSAVAAEVGVVCPQRAMWLRRWVSSPALGSLGAAAMLLLCIGLVWYVGQVKPSVSPGEVDRFVEAVTESSTDPILTEVQSLEDDLSRNAALTEDENESLGDLVREMDRLLDERTQTRNTSDTGLKRTRVIG